MIKQKHRQLGTNCLWWRNGFCSFTLCWKNILPKRSAGPLTICFAEFRDILPGYSQHSLQKKQACAAWIKPGDPLPAKDKRSVLALCPSGQPKAKRGRDPYSNLQPSSLPHYRYLCLRVHASRSKPEEEFTLPTVYSGRYAAALAA